MKLSEDEQRAVIRKWPTSLVVQAVAVDSARILNPYSWWPLEIECPGLGRATRETLNTILRLACEELNRRLPVPTEEV
jgi:hypothetical protein